jgi:hypothetical protein
MSKQRQDIVKKAFAQLDKKGSGRVAPDVLIGQYDPTHHPSVTDGHKSKD